MLLRGLAREADTQFGVTDKGFRFNDFSLFSADDWEVGRKPASGALVAVHGLSNLVEAFLLFVRPGSAAFSASQPHVVSLYSAAATL